MRTTVDMPDELMRRVKGVAAMRGVKLKELFTQLIEIGLISYDPPVSKNREPLPVFDTLRERESLMLSSTEIEALLTEEDARRS